LSYERTNQQYTAVRSLPLRAGGASTGTAVIERLIF